jgi:hypothetical protein
LDEDGLGLENASFKWNEVSEEGNIVSNPESGKKDKTLASTDDVETRSATVIEGQPDNGGGGGLGSHRFELRDIDVVFPEGELSVVTGPTASGKTALLVSLTSDFYGFAETCCVSDGTPW